MAAAVAWNLRTLPRRRRRDGGRFPLPAAAAVSHFDYSEPDVGYIWGNVGGYYSCSAAAGRFIQSRTKERLSPPRLISNPKTQRLPSSGQWGQRRRRA